MESPLANSVQALDEPYDRLSARFDRLVAVLPSHHEARSALYMWRGQAVEYLLLKLVTLTLAAHHSTSSAREAGSGTR